MGRAFADIAFTETVRKIQRELGSEGHLATLLDADEPRADRVGPDEHAFIAQRDGFYQATVSETGWPYVQFRGGPRGFLKVLNEATLAYADFRGNRQYVSAGNICDDGRVSLLLMDYPNQRRLKVWGRARLSNDAGLLARLHHAAYKAHPERAVIVDIEALDWNCPAHIPQRLTVEELGPILSPLREELEALRAENAALKAERP
ncbi:MAG: pyridoxamine 5'-phosphate oxidase family protein [Pikeienuella sp.]